MVLPNISNDEIPSLYPKGVEHVQVPSGESYEENESPDSGFNSDNSSNSATADEDIQTLIGELDEKLQLSDGELLDSALSDEIDLMIVNDNDDKNAMTFEKTSTISDIISRSVGDLNPDDYDLKIDGRVLARTVSLRDAGITNGSKLRLVERQIQVFIRRVDGRTSTFDTVSSSTVQSLKEQFFYTDQVPVHQQRLLFQSKELENARTLQFYGIRNNSTLEMVYRLRGGHV